MKVLHLVLSCLFGASAAFGSSAFPTVGNVVLSQTKGRPVEVTYDLLDAEAVVTVAFMTNGVPLPGSALQSVRGDVSVVVAPGVGRKIVWRPWKSWPGGWTGGDVTVRVSAWPISSPPPYMVVALDGSKEVRYYETEDALPGGIGLDDYRCGKMVFRKISAATSCFRAGSPKTEAGRASDETKGETTRYVSLTNDFYLGVFPVTQGQFRSLGTKASPSFSTTGDSLPADGLSGEHVGLPYASPSGIGDEACEPGSLLAAARERTGFVRLHLPTEAEWEFACRAGGYGAVYGGLAVGDAAWYADNSGGTLQPVGLKAPNAFGLYDMLGNVWERVRDSAGRAVSGEELIAPFDGTNSHGSYQLMCGGAFDSAETAVRAASRTPGSDWQTHNYQTAEPGFGVRLKIPLK